MFGFLARLGALEANHRITVGGDKAYDTADFVAELRDLGVALGGHTEQCDACSHIRISYNSCRNRHCGKCQALARAAWLEARQADLLPVPYFHVVFTIPQWRWPTRTIVTKP
jgi:hypothetical protein